MQQGKSNKVVVIDFETALTSGEPSVDHYRSDFRAVSCGFAWDDQLRYVEGEREIRRQLQALVKAQHKIVVHNLQFDYGVVWDRFRDLADKLNWHADTLRLTANADNGGKSGSYRLEECAKRWLPLALQNHKQPFYDLIAERGGIGGQDLHLLSDSELEAYTLLDVKVTLELYRTLTAYFKEINYDWTLDHTLFLTEAKLYAKAKSRGILVDRDRIREACREISNAFDGTEARFRLENATGIAAVEALLKQAELDRYKTERGRQNANPLNWQFNVDSTLHLKKLFVDHYDIKPKFFTPGGEASMASKFMTQYGELSLIHI